jgi:hypothetical protein
MSLTSKQERFARNIAAGMTGSDAARAAGYADNSNHGLAVTASRLMRHPGIQREAFEQREARLTGPLARKALGTLESILDDETAPAAARVQAARFVLEAAGHGIESRRLAARQPDDDGRPLHLLSLASLEALAFGAEERLRIAKEGAIDAEEVERSAE